MTPSEIKKIAEEYANGTLTELSTGIDKDNAKFLMSDIENFLQHLSARFYLVEKGKVEEEYEAAKWHKETAEGMNVQFGKGMARGQIMTLENLFGSEIGKEEE